MYILYIYVSQIENWYIPDKSQSPITDYRFMFICGLIFIDKMTTYMHPHLSDTGSVQKGND